MLSRCNQNTPGMCFPLAMTREGEQVVCVELLGGPGLRKHLADMGVTPGTRIAVLSGGSRPGPVVAKIRGSKVMLGRRMALKIMVRPAW